jgi:hypothetical protein
MFLNLFTLIKSNTLLYTQSFAIFSYIQVIKTQVDSE